MHRRRKLPGSRQRRPLFRRWFYDDDEAMFDDREVEIDGPPKEITPPTQ